MLLDLWKVARTRKAVILLLDPLFARSVRHRGRPIGAATWHDPYFVGFLSTLVALAATSVAKRKLTSDNLGLITLDVWAALTGVPDPSVGQRIADHSANRNPAFLDGCRNASEFFEQWMSAPGRAPGPYDGAIPSGRPSGARRLATANRNGEAAEPFDAPTSAAAALWASHFDDRIDD